MKLEVVADGFFNEFASGVEENYRLKGLGHAIGVFVGFGDDNCYGSFEV